MEDLKIPLVAGGDGGQVAKVIGAFPQTEGKGSEEWIELEVAVGHGGQDRVRES